MNRKSFIIIHSAVCAVLLAISVVQNAECKPKSKTSDKNSNPIIVFLKENDVSLDKKVVAIQFTGQESVGKSQVAVMKLISIKDEPDLRKMKFASKEEEQAARKSAAFIKGINKLSANVIKTVITSIVSGTVIKDGDTAKVADLQIFFEDSSSFNVVVGEDFSQIVFEKIISKPENPFSKEPIEKSIKTLSFVSPDLLKSVRLILEPKRE